jgi:hypothetical protein
MRIRQERMIRIYAQQTYRAIEAENHRATEPRLPKQAEPASIGLQADVRSATEIARAAGAALKGSIAA